MSSQTAKRRLRLATARYRPVAPIIMIMPDLNATHFYQYLTCPMWVWFDAHGDKKKKAPDSELTAMLKKRGTEHEKRIVRLMGPVEVDGDDVDEQVSDTLDLMGQGKLIYHGRLVLDGWVGIPDLLVPEKGKSKLGPWVYAPMDVKSSMEVQDEHRFQLVFYAVLLQKIQGVLPENGYIITGSGDRITIPIAPLLERFHATRTEIEKILSGEKPAPFFSSSCKQSPWFESCRGEAVACDDLSLIYRLRRDEYASLRAQGIDTIHAMATADLDTLRKKTDISIGRLERLQEHAACYVHNTHAIITPPSLPQAQVEVYYDVESDTIPEPNLHYLHGVLIVEKPHGRRTVEKVTYKKFVVRDPAHEDVAWHDFMDFISALPDNTAIYHYGAYEHRVVRELTERYGAPKAALIRLGEMVDLLKEAQNVLFPVHFYSLKDIAKYLGFRWRTKGATGGASVEWYHSWRKSKKAALLKKIVEYNEDDVRATKVLKDFLAGL